ncbi:MAG: hypothetical protein Tsb009_25800 [Planctomycetaceae bacterium]
MDTGELTTGAGGGVCSICQSPIITGDPIRTCESCSSKFHDECYQHNAGCGTYGCDRAPETLKMYVAGEEATGAWGDVKYCPNCNELIESRALKCPACKATFDTRAPMTPEEYQAQLERQQRGKRNVWIAVIIFIGSAFGILAPVTLVGALVVLFSSREPGRKAAQVSDLLNLASVALSAAYLVLMILIFGFGW